MPGIIMLCDMPGIMSCEASASGTGCPRSRSQRCMVAICPTTIRSQSAVSDGLAPCDGAHPAISTACAWWPIMPVMK